MKKIMTVFLTALLAFTFVSCSSDGNDFTIIATYTSKRKEIKNDDIKTDKILTQISTFGEPSGYTTANLSEIYVTRTIEFGDSGAFVYSSFYTGKINSDDIAIIGRLFGRYSGKIDEISEITPKIDRGQYYDDYTKSTRNMPITGFQEKKWTITSKDDTLTLEDAVFGETLTMSKTK